MSSHQSKVSFSEHRNLEKVSFHHRTGLSNLQNFFTQMENLNRHTCTIHEKLRLSLVLNVNIS